MTRHDGGLTRRGLLTTWGAWLAAALAGHGRRLGARIESQQNDRSSTARSRVVLVRRQRVLADGRRPDPQMLHQMLNEAVTALLEEENAAAAWRRLVTARDVVAVKSNVWSPLPTPAELEEALRSELLAAGVRPENLAIDDRGLRHDPVFQRATALINVRPMRTHHWSGLGTCLKNYVNLTPRPSDYHADACADLGAVWVRLGARQRTRLNVLVMLTPQFHSVGPHGFSERFVWPYRGLLVGADPVAVDAIGARIIAAQRKRHFGEERPLQPPPHHIELAETRHRLGVSDPARIDLVRLGWQEESLI